ncbi:hypothetical protein CYMTET_46057 [Cymbomonas tetramitiformis]|uniref:Uncharacterized protein n=1 Tax=Cymbomonas tetramitiformis TaxID=36881 RepID=A0AAE0EXP0_9CHLO|nr:hypothetical protein CYMTET_46057 [Cymbomonas tetramitiformis]
MGSKKKITFKPPEIPFVVVEQLGDIPVAAITSLDWVPFSANVDGTHPESRVPVCVQYSDGEWYYGLLIGVKPRVNEFLVVFTDGEIALCTKQETHYLKEIVESKEARLFVKCFNEQLAVCEVFNTWLSTVDIPLLALYTTTDPPASPGRSTELSVPKHAGPAVVAGAAAATAAETGAEETTAANCPAAQAGAAAAVAAAAASEAESEAAAADKAMSDAAAGGATAAGAGQAAVVAQAGAGKAVTAAADEAATGEALSEAAAGGKTAAGAAEVAATKTGAAQVAVEAQPGAKEAVTAASGAAASGAAAAGKAAAGKAISVAAAAGKAAAGKAAAGKAAAGKAAAGKAISVAAAGKAISVAAAAGAAATGEEGPDAAQAKISDANKAPSEIVDLTEDNAPVGSPSPATTSKPQTGNKAATAGAAAAGASKAGAAEAGAAKATSTKGQSRYRSLNGPAAAGASGNKAASAGAAETEAETPKGKKAKIEYPYVYCGTAYAIDKKTNLPGLFACLSYPESDAGSVYLEPISKMLEIADQPWYIEKEVAAQECQDYDKVQPVHIQEPVLRYLVDQHLEQCSTEEAASFMVKLVQEFGSKNSGGQKALMKLVRQQLAKD